MNQILNLIAIVALLPFTVPAEEGPARADAQGLVAGNVPIPDGKEVGLIGRGHRIEFHGNQVFSDAALRRGLATSAPFQLAARPKEPMAELFETLDDVLTRGYRLSGCPDAQVEVGYQPDNKQHPIIVEITEGERFRKGKIIIRGDEGIDRDALAHWLSQPRERSAELALCDRIQKMIEYESTDLLPPPVQIGPTPFDRPDDSQAVPWESGSAASFKESGMTPLWLDVARGLAAFGHANATFSTGYLSGGNGVVDLEINIQGLGPDPVIGQVIIDGADRFEREEILELVGLRHGQPIRPQQIDVALMNLWRSGRFYPFAIDAFPRGRGAAQVDLRLRLKEVDGAPDLGEELSVEQEAATLFTEWVNREMDREEIVFRYKPEQLNRVELVVGWSSDLGLLVDWVIPQQDQQLTIRLSEDKISILTIEGKNRSSMIIPISGIHGKLSILPTGDGSSFGIAAGLGMPVGQAKLSQAGLISTLISPALPLLKKDDFARDGKVVVMNDWLRLDLESGVPVGFPDGVVEVATGWLADRVMQHDADLARAAMETTSITEMVKVVMGMVQGVAPELVEAGLPKVLADKFQESAFLLNLVHEAGGLEVLEPLLRVPGGDEDTGGFRVPSDFEAITIMGGRFVLLEFGLISVIEEFFPDADWPIAFARERVLMIESDDVDENLEFIARNASLGPVSGLLCHRLLKGPRRAASQLFLRRAQEVSTAEGFGNDWQLLMGRGSTLAPHLLRTYQALVALTPERKKQAVRQLGPDLKEWGDRLFTALRPADDLDMVEQILSKPMEELWDDQVAGWVEGQLAEHLLPPVDPEVMAATINGRGVPRFLVRFLRELKMPMFKQMPLPDRHHPFYPTNDRDLLAALRLGLIVEVVRSREGLPPREAGFAVADRGFASLAGKNEAEWIEVTGFTRAQLAEWFIIKSLAERALSAIVQDRREEPAEADLREHFEKYRELFQVRYWADLVFMKAEDQVRLRRLATSHRLAKAIAKLPDELPLNLVSQLADEDMDSGCRIFAREGELADMFPVELLDQLQMLRPGEATDSLNMGQGVAVLRLNKREPDPGITLADVKDIVGEHWRMKKAHEEVESWFKQVESNFSIEVLDAPNREALGEVNAFDQFLMERPDSLLGRYLSTWSQLESPDEKVLEGAFSRIFTGEGVDRPLIESEMNLQTEALRVLLNRAAKRRPELTSSSIAKVIDDHSGHGPACKMGSILMPILKQLKGEKEVAPE